MRISLSSQQLDALDSDLLVIPVATDWKSAPVQQLDRALDGKLIPELAQQGFRGEAGTAAWFQTHGALPTHHLLLIGVGDEPDCAAWHKLAQVTIDRAREIKATTVAVAPPHEMLSAAAVEHLLEGIFLSSYVFEQLKATVKPYTTQVERFVLVTDARGADLRKTLASARTSAAAVCYARDLINLPAAIVTPSYLGREARRLARAQRLHARILAPPAIKRAGMGALLGVAQGSAEPARFIELIYRPAGKARRTVALVGKGITFDSGGLSIKTAEAMQAQKRDMAGGAVVLAVMSVVRDLALPVEVRGYVAATENMPGGRALKPGDVVRACNGKSIEVLNTDAEGRLVLADALAYAAASKPDILIDLATLTAAVRAALGTRYAAIMGTDSALVQALIAAARTCAENLWEFPLIREYRSDLDSHVADLKNIGNGSAGTIVAGLFLREFVGTVPWAHIDFSSTVMAEKPFPAHPPGATGFGVRTVLRYLRTL